MLKAVDYEILRDVTAGSRTKIPLARKPVRVATLIDESAFMLEQMMVHNRTVFFEDLMHDWSWSDGWFRYYTRTAEKADVLVVYEEEDVKPVARFDAMTGKPLPPA